jgi:hypothetical protein
MTPDDTTTDDTPQGTPTPDSYLIADIGTIETTVVLFDVAAGSYRLLARGVAPTTAVPPWSDVMVGVRQAIQMIETATGRSLVDNQQKLISPARLNGSGVDKFAVVANAARPLQTLLVGLFDEVSLKSARQALGSTYATEIDCFSLNDPRDEGEKFSAVIEQKPELIFIVGGTDGGASQRLLKLVDTLRMGVNVLAESGRVFVIYAGNKQAREAVTSRLQESAHVQVAENVRPDLETADIDEAATLVNALYEDVKLSRLPGMRALQSWGGEKITPTATAFATIARYFAALQNNSILGVDVQSDSVSFVTADAQRAQVHIRTDLGMGKPLAHLLDFVSPADIARWVPLEVSEEEIRDFITYKSLYPQTVPQSELELYLEQAAARELIRCAAPDKLPVYKMILARGPVLTNAPRPGQTVLMLLDALQPKGIFSIALDKYNVLPALGALALEQPTAVVQALEAGVLEDLGWVIVPYGKSQTGKPVITGVLESENLGQFNLDIEDGAIETAVLAPGQAAAVDLKPGKRMDIGYGEGKGKKITVRGGAVGLVIDARGRPLSVPQTEERLDLVRKWYWDVGG